MHRTDRIEMRAEPRARQRIAEAAALLKESISTFVLRAAEAEADRVLARVDMVFMDARQFDVMIESLDRADSAPQLAATARRERVYRRS